MNSVMFQLRGILSGKANRWCVHPRYQITVMFGLIVGFTLSLFCAPFYDCDWRNGSLGVNQPLRQKQLDIIRSKLKDLKLKDEQLLHQQIDDFEPRINLQDKPKQPSKPTKKLVRPRYLSMELNMRKRLFVGILSSSRSLPVKFLPFLNETLVPVANQLTFFVNNPNTDENKLLDDTPTGVHLVNFKDDNDNLLAMHTLKYIQDNYLEQYDWFFLVSDTTYVRSSRLLKLINSISITQDLYMGFSLADNYQIYCSISSGILFSNTLMHKMYPEMEWCTKNSFSAESTENIGRCVMHSAELKCTQTANGYTANFHLDPYFDFDSNITKLIESSQFNQSITVSHIKDPETMKKLQIYYNLVEMAEIDVKIKEYEEEIMSLVCETPEGCDSLIWPLGVVEPFKPEIRHDVIRWDYFNRTHVFFINDFQVVNEMSEHLKLDTDEAIEFSLDELKKKDRVKYRLVRLINGYRRFEPGRGVSYVMDLELRSPGSERTMHKRVNVLRPLGLTEILPMPYVNESPNIVLVIYFSEEYDLSKLKAFFASYESLILSNKAAAKKVELFIIFLQRKNSANSEKYLEVIEIISSLIKKHTIQILHAKLDMTQVKDENTYLNENYRQMAVVEFISTHLSEETLIFLASPCIEIEPDFLNRVRLNTIKANQAFFPITFEEFKPEIAYGNDRNSWPNRIKINKNNGHFDVTSFRFISYYNEDYKVARRNLNKALESPNNDLLPHWTPALDMYELFTKHSDLHVLRATDSGFKCRWEYPPNCDLTGLTEEQVELCHTHRDLSLGTRNQLASYIIQNYQDFFNTK